MCYCFLFFNDTATTEIYTLSLHDALPILYPKPLQQPMPIYVGGNAEGNLVRAAELAHGWLPAVMSPREIREGFTKIQRSEEHTSELQSRQYLVCRLLLEKKN